MGLFRAASSAVGGVFADQWREFLTVPDGLPSSAALFAPVARSGDGVGRGSNDRRSPGVITNGSKFVVPEGYALVLIEEGGVTGLVTEPGNYEWDSDAPDSQSFFEGGNYWAPLVRASWERFKFGGRPSSEQQALFVSLKELPGNRFGTASEIYWDDAYLNAQVGAIARGTYTLRITDPILFIRNWLSADYLQSGAVFDFTDPGNIWAKQLFHEVVGCLAQALSFYANDPAMANRMTRIQQDTVGFADRLSASVEEAYRWRSDRGLEIVKATIVGLEYDRATRELLTTVQRADALAGGERTRTFAPQWRTASRPRLRMMVRRASSVWRWRPVRWATSFHRTLLPHHQRPLRSRRLRMPPRQAIRWPRSRSSSNCWMPDSSRRMITTRPSRRCSASESEPVLLRR